MKFSLARVKLPTLTNSLLAIFSAILLTLAFPNFDLWFLAWFALVPLFYAIEREKESVLKNSILGWLFGVVFFSASCWWLTFSFTTYGGIPAPIAYFLLFIICSIVGIFPAIFATAFSLVLRRFGNYGILFAPFLWTAQEFLRASLADTSWNAVGYAMAFVDGSGINLVSIGGVYLLSFYFLFWNSAMFFFLKEVREILTDKKKFIVFFVYLGVFQNLFYILSKVSEPTISNNEKAASVAVVQANVPMSGLNEEKWLKLRTRHVELAENALQKISEQRTANDEQPTLVVFPESPMNFAYGDDPEFRQFIGDFAREHNASVLFNSAEPNPNADNRFNSAIMINPRGEKIGQYDKIHLVPFGEFAPVPSPIKPLIPTLVGSFEPGVNYNLFPVGDARAGIMICYESHFPSLSREFARRGADVLIEMTNDGYLGDTGVLRQHLSGAIFRAVETNRPVIRATNVGITAYINERGEVSDAADVYTEATRVWTVSKSDGKQTFYVRFGDWFAWFCSVVSLGLIIFSFRRNKNET